MGRGGFVSVEVFFVISGFLITTIIDAQRDQGRRCILEFYAKRFRRLFSSLLIAMAFTVAAGWKVLLPDEYLTLGRPLKAGLVFYENFPLRREAD